MVEAVLTWILIQEALHERAAWVRSKEKVGNAGKAEAKDIKVFPQSSRGEKVLPRGLPREWPGHYASPQTTPGSR